MSGHLKNFNIFAFARPSAKFKATGVKNSDRKPAFQLRFKTKIKSSGSSFRVFVLLYLVFIGS